MTREQVAGDLHVSTRTVDRWEDENVPPPAVALVAFYCLYGQLRIHTPGSAADRRVKCPRLEELVRLRDVALSTRARKSGEVAA